jgi:hypothetical protein
VRRAAKIDDNQRSIVDALRAIGASVQTLAPVGQGCPDLLVGYKGHNYLLEVKDGNKVASARRLTPLQEVWHRQWAGSPVAVVRSPDEALALLLEVTT